MLQRVVHVTTLAYVRLPLTHYWCFYFDMKLEETPLLEAVRSGKSDMLNALLRNEANSDLRDKVSSVCLLWDYVSFM